MKFEYYGWDDGTSLYHYGIPGQKWGIRRWQNADGSFNEEGKKRYGRISTSTPPSQKVTIMRDFVHTRSNVSKKDQDDFNKLYDTYKNYKKSELYNGLLKRNDLWVTDKNGYTRFNGDSEVAKLQEKLLQKALKSKAVTDFMRDPAVKRTYEARNKALDDNKLDDYAWIRASEQYEKSIRILTNTFMRDKQSADRLLEIIKENDSTTPITNNDFRWYYNSRAWRWWS